MFARKNKVALTLLCLVVALGLATVSEANSLVHSPRDHVELNRMIKKRAPQSEGLIPIIIGAEGNPTGSVSTDTASATSAASASTTGTNPASVTSGTATSGTASATSGTDSASATGTSSLSASSSSAASSSSSAASSSSSLPSSSSSATSSSSSSSSQATTSAPSTPTADTATDTLPSSTHTATKIVTASDTDQPSASSGASTSGATSSNSKITRTTLTVIIVIAASIGFIALAWTLFRKWKLRPSSNFDDRMQPIDWQPTGPEESGLPGVRRGNSTASHGSFQSSGHGHGGLEPLPEHDFTAGPTSLAPVGGYADLQRGPSPQPMAQLQRGPSATRADYAAYDYNTGVRY